MDYSFFDEYREKSAEAKKAAIRMRKNYIEKIKYKEMSLRDLIYISRDDSFRYLRKIKIIDLMDECYPGWTKNSLKHAFVSYDIPVDLTVGRCITNTRLSDHVIALSDSSASRWQERIKAPEGWPWHGNIMKVLGELDIETLPTEIQSAVRFYFDEDDKFNPEQKTDKDEDQIIESDPVNTSDVYVDDDGDEDQIDEPVNKEKPWDDEGESININDILGLEWRDD